MTEQVTQEAVNHFLRGRFAAETNSRPEQIDINALISSYRLDSVIVVALAADLEEWLHCPIDSSIFWEFDTIADLSRWLVQEYLPDQQR